MLLMGVATGFMQMLVVHFIIQKLSLDLLYLINLWHFIKSLLDLSMVIWSKVKVMETFPWQELQEVSVGTQTAKQFLVQSFRFKHPSFWVDSKSSIEIQTNVWTQTHLGFVQLFDRAPELQWTESEFIFEKNQAGFTSRGADSLSLWLIKCD